MKSLTQDTGLIVQSMAGNDTQWAFMLVGLIPLQTYIGALNQSGFNLSCVNMEDSFVEIVQDDGKSIWGYYLPLRASAEEFANWLTYMDRDGLMTIFDIDTNDPFHVCQMTGFGFEQLLLTDWLPQIRSRFLVDLK